MFGGRKFFSEKFMYMIIIIWFSSEVILNTRLERILYWDAADCNNFFARLTLLLLSVQIIVLQEYKPIELITVVMATIPIIIGTLNSGNNLMISAWMFIVASKYVDIEKVVKIAYIILLVTIPIVIVLCFGGIIEDRIIFRGSMIRHSWGFAHPNWLGVRVFQLVIMHSYLKRKHLAVIDYLIIFLGAIFVKVIPNCKTAYYMLLICLIMLIVFRLLDYIDGGQEFFAKATIALAMGANAIAVLLSVIDVKSVAILRKIDAFMSNRFYWCHKVLENYGWSLLGQKIEIYSRRMGVVFPRFYLDTAYMALLLRYGVIVYVFFTVIYLMTMIRCLKQKNYMLVIILSVYALYGVMENALFSVTQNIFLLALAIPLFEMESQEKSETVVDGRRRYKLIF